MSVNRALLVGRLGCDPEMKVLESGRQRTQFRLATNKYWTDKNGERQERTYWHRVVTWGKQAEIAKNHLSKGEQVCVEGEITHRKWTDKEGQERYITEVEAKHITFLGRSSANRGRNDPHAPPVPLVEQSSVPF